MQGDDLALGADSTFLAWLIVVGILVSYRKNLALLVPTPKGVFRHVLFDERHILW